MVSQTSSEQGPAHNTNTSNVVNPPDQSNNTETDTNMAVATSLPPLRTQQFTNSPPISATSSPSGISKKRSRSPLSLDLSSLPGLISPAPPSNTLLITKLNDPKIFHPASLATIRQHINSISALNSFSPLKSMARIIVSFASEEDCIRVRKEIDGSAFTPHVIAKCYFGEPTPIDSGMKYLERPDAGKLFFISPPPSPPVGWESRMEDPPNKEVHADDLAAKLSMLTGKLENNPDSPTDTAPITTTAATAQAQFSADEITKLKTASHRRAISGVPEDMSPATAGTPRGRSRSSTLIYDPIAHGDSPNLPAVTLETEDDMEVQLDSEVKQPLAHTSRPPVELMDQ